MRLFRSPTRKLGIVIATMILATTLATLSVTTQTAHAGWLGECQKRSHTLCLFAHPKYNGNVDGFVDFWDVNKKTKCANIREAFRDQISSVYVSKPNKSFTVYAYSGTGCSGRISGFSFTNVYPGIKLSDTMLSKSEGNDRIRSIAII
jgi:hypothetical protein